MRLETRDPTNAAFAAGDKFACNKAPHVILTMRTVEESRIMSLHDEYTELNLTAADAVTALPATFEDAPEATETITVTVVDDGPDPLATKVVTAVSADTDVVTVSPAGVITDASGEAVFTLTAVADGGPVNVTFTCDSATDTVAVTIATA